jgi:hypothetical protein
VRPFVNYAGPGTYVVLMAVLDGGLKEGRSPGRVQCAGSWCLRLLY